MFKIYIIEFVLLFLFYSCISAPKFTTRKVEPPVSGNEEIHNNVGLNKELVLESVTGIASYYAKEFNGQVTYSGEIYDMYGLTAAHPTYPMGTKLRVTNLSNLKSVILEVNDRMPNWPDRIIDLSLGAAIQLGMVKDGLAEVRIDVLQWGTGKK
ncbi:septal ring lytic transglycosylase RlpA family protein [Melioribacteraceae bacterium 4301-Me]|uniref:septal ring lytic transglycosylase RlpA family protein n=1 Tax=Pyranulibacter aquaticus TaxID=3163344 RepID=UPI00359720E4